MKIVSNCFNFVKTMLSYHIKFKNCLFHRNGAKILFKMDIQQKCTNQRFVIILKHLLKICTKL